MSALPWFFVALAGFALLSGLYLIWESLRAALGATEPLEVQATAEADARRRLLERKEALLKNLRDLKFDYDAGKMSTPDFEALDAKLRGQAREVLRLLDEDAAPFRQRAEEAIAARLKSAGQTPYRSKPADAAATESPKPAAKVSGDKVACAACDTPNDPDAVFCKKCGARVHGDDADASAPEEEERT